MCSQPEGDFLRYLRRSKLVVANNTIRVETPTETVIQLDDFKNMLAATIQDLQDPATQSGDPIERAIKLLQSARDAFPARARDQQSNPHGGGLLHKSLHKGLHKSLHKGLFQSGSGSGYATGEQLSWPTIEVPWRELGLLYQARDTFKWDKWADATGGPPILEPPLPPGSDEMHEELEGVYQKQIELRKPENAYLRQRIVVEASNDLTAYMLPLGADAAAPASQTAILFQTILWLGSLIGLTYKAKFDAPRPHVLDPRLEPFIPVPTYASYPSNHAFQSFLIAEVFARAVPEHSGAAALFDSAAAVAENREYAGLHVPSDTAAGRQLARLCTPVFEDVLEDQIRIVREEWLGGGI